MGYLPETVKDLIRLGGNIVIKGNYLPETLKEFARLAKEHNVTVTLKAGTYLPETLKDIVRIGGKNVTIEL